MCRLASAVGLCFCLLSAVRADDATARLEGVSLGKVPGAVYAQVPTLPAGKGILVMAVAPGSAAARAGLKQYDVLVSLDGRSLDRVEALTLSTSTNQVPIVLFRSGREMTLRVASAHLLHVAEPTGPKAMLKPGGLPAVAVEAKPLPGDRLTVTFTYFAIGSSKLERVNCSGSVDEIKKHVKDLGRQKQMPQQVKDLADVALERLRVLNTPSKKE